MTLPVFVRGHHRGAGLLNVRRAAGSSCDFGHLVSEYREVRGVKGARCQSDGLSHQVY